MVNRGAIVAGFVFAALSGPAFADATPGANPSVSPANGPTPTVTRGHFPHRKPNGKAVNQGLTYTGAAFGAGFVVTLGQIFSGPGSSGVAPPVSGQ